MCITKFWVGKKCVCYSGVQIVAMIAMGDCDWHLLRMCVCDWQQLLCVSDWQQLLCICGWHVLWLWVRFLDWQLQTCAFEWQLWLTAAAIVCFVIDSCFIALLLMAGCVWRIKRCCDRHRAIQVTAAGCMRRDVTPLDIFAYSKSDSLCFTCLSAVAYFWLYYHCAKYFPSMSVICPSCYHSFLMFYSTDNAVSVCVRVSTAYEGGAWAVG